MTVGVEQVVHAEATDDHSCQYPRCIDYEGHVRLLEPGYVTFCRSSRRRYKHVLGWLLGDYVLLHAAMPSPVSDPGAQRVSLSKEFGHPAEWASDMKRRIAYHLDWVADDLRDYLHHTPANTTRREARKVATEQRYLVAQFETLCMFPGAVPAATELDKLHGEIRSMLGQTRPSYHLDTPCPDCDLLTMRRTVDIDRSDSIECLNCGRTISEAEYGLYVRILLDEILDDTDDTPITA